MNRYELRSLTELCDVLSGGTPKTSIPEYWGGNIPWASVKDFNIGSRWFSSTEKSITQEGLARCSSELLQVGELILSSRGTVGVVAQCTMETAFNQSNYGLRARESVTSNDFLYYLVSFASKELQAKSHGGMFDTITRETLQRLEVPLPARTTQKVIESILGSLDAKIRLNTELSKTLEAIAQTIFKSWFIDFDPVHAKMRGEKPEGMSDEVAALFPDSFEESELGLIPTGWKVEALDEIATFLNGLALQKFPPRDEDDRLPVIKIAQLRAGSTKSADFASCSIKDEYVVSDGDILFSWSGTLEVEMWAGGKGALNQHLFKVTGETVPNWFAYFGTRAHLDEFRRIASGKATTMGHIQRGHLSEAKVVVPPPALLEEAHLITSPLIEKMVLVRLESKVLDEVRDALLPRLISGELEIPSEMLAS